MRFVKGEASKESTLTQANVEHAERAIVLALDARDPHSDNHTLAAVLVLEQLNSNWGSADSRTASSILRMNSKYEPGKASSANAPASGSKARQNSAM